MTRTQPGIALVACFIFSGLVGTDRVSADESSVVFYHSFEGKAEAEIAIAPEVEVIDGPVAFDAGKRGKAMVAGDGKAYLVFDASNIPAREGTLELWLKPLNWDAMSTDTFHVFVETDKDDDGHWFLVYKYYHAQNAGFIWENGGSIFQRKITGWRDWVHFAVTWSPTGCRMYFNGKPSAVSLPKDPPTQYVGRMMVGDRPWQFARDEQTLFDELYIYSRALEPEEIAWALANVETRPAGKDVPPGLVPTKVYAKILPSSGKIIAQVRRRPDRDTAKDVTGTVELIGPTPIPAVPLDAEDETAQATLSFTKLDTGDYTLRVEFKDASGKVVDEAEDKFFCPANEWLGNTIGITDTAPAPWTTVEASPTRFSCWGRTYDLGRSGLPKRIASAGASVLSRPVQLHATANGRAVKWTYDGPTLVSQSDVDAEYEGEWTSSVGTVRWKAVGEYDGMFKYTFTLTPSPDASLDSLELRFPLRPECATLINALTADASHIGATPTGKGVVVKSPGARQWWLGDEDRGLLAFCDSDQAWDRIDREDGFRIERKKSSVDVVWSFIDGKTTLTTPWTFTFGLTATPVRDTRGLRGRPSRVLPMNKWVMPRPRNYTPVGVEDLLANEGMRDEAPGRFLVVWGGGEWRTYDQDWGRPQAYREGMDKLAAKGLSVMTYMMPREIPESVPEWRFWSEEWALGKKGAWTEDIWDSTTCVASWVDFTVAFRMGLIRKYGYGGFYTDNSMVCPGRNLHAGVGYVRDGRIRPAYNYFGLREVFKRLYTALKQYGAEQGKPTMIMSHMSNELPVSFLGFMDNRLDGEQYMGPVRKERKRYHDLIALEKWRALGLSANMGSMSVFLPEFHKEDLADETKTRELLGLLMLHDMIGVWFSVDNQARTDAVYAMWRVQDAFGVEDAELIPYWKNARIIGGQTDTIKASAYRKSEGGALVVVCNLSGEQRTTNLRVAWDKLKSNGTLSVVDAESGESLDVAGGRLKLDIAPRGCAIVWCK